MPINVNITIDYDTKEMSFIDNTDYSGLLLSLFPPGPGDPLPSSSDIWTNVRVEWGDGINVPYGSSITPFLSSANSWASDLYLRYGSAKVIYSAYRVSDNILVDSVEFNFVEPVPTIGVTEQFDFFAPSILLADTTDYSLSGFTTSHQRGWVAGDLSGSLENIDVNSAPGEYTFELTNKVTYSGEVTIIKTYSSEGEYEIIRPIMLPELIACLKLLLAKRNSFSCCNDAQYALINEDYQTAMGLFTLFHASGQVPVTADLQPVLDEIMSIFSKWSITCAIDTDVTPIATYDFCLCPGGSGGSDEVYDATNGAWISADATGVVFSKSSGTGSFSLNSATIIYGGSVRGTSGDATADINGATNSFVLTIPTKAGNASGASALLAGCHVYDATNIDAVAEDAPMVADNGAVGKYVTRIGSNSIDVAFIGIGSIYSGGWLVTFVNP